MDNHEYLDKKGLGQLLSNLKSKYIEKFSVNGKTVTYTRGDGTTGQFTTQDTTYSAATTEKDGLMSAEDKNKLSGIATGANKTVVDSSLSSTSTNPVQNKVVNSALADKVPVSRTVNGKALSANITLSASDVSADAKGTASSAVSSHNTSTSAHNDIRTLITTLTTRLNALADSDDTTLDQMSEIVDYIKSNRSLIESVTTSKVSVTDIVNNLTTNVTNKPLSAAQGVEIKKLIDALQTAVDGKAASGHKHAASDITSGTLSSDRLPVVPASKGGTGQTSLNNSANVLINALTTGDSTPTDADYYISQSVSGGTTTTTYHRRPMSALWAYIKGKTDTLYAKISHTHKISDISDLTATATELNYVDGVTSNVQTQLDTKAKASDLTSHTGNKSNPHGVTKAQIGLGNVENKSSEAIRSELTKANVTSALGYTPPTTNTTYGVATTSANGLMSSTDKKRVDSFAGNYNLGSMSGKTVADLQSALKTWLASYYNIANATCYFTGDSSWVTLWNAGDTTSTIPAGSMFTVRVAGFFGNGTYAQLEITSYYDKSVYYTALQNNSWQSVRKVAFDSDLSTKQNTITGGGSTITTSNLTANRALISNGSGKVAVSDVTSTELGYLDGVTSNVQTQLDGKLSTTGTAASATKLATARTIQTNLGSTSSASFNGTANVTPGVTGTLGVANGGTGLATLPSGQVLVGNGTSAITTRSITNNTSKTYISYNSNLMTTNTLAYWNGAYNSSGASNLTYCTKGAFGTAAIKDADYFATAGHTHNYAGSDSAGGAANKTKGTLIINLDNGADGTSTSRGFDGSEDVEFSVAGIYHYHEYLKRKGVNTISSTTNDTVANWGKQNISVHNYNTTGLITDQPSQYGFLFNLSNGATEVHQIFACSPGNNLYHRGGNSSGWNGTWKMIVDSSNYGTVLAGGTINGNLTVTGALYSSNWFRSYNATGWYNETYAGGWYMTDTSWIRAYNDKGIYTGGVMQCGGGFKIGATSYFNGCIELYGSAPYIDFHFNNSTADYTSRIVEDESGILTVTGQLRANQGIRIRSSNGIYWQDYNGGWYMEDSTWLRSRNNKNIYTGGSIRADGLDQGGQLNLAYGNYSVMFRNDGSAFYILFSKSGQLTTWDSKFPFYFSIPYGGVHMQTDKHFEGNTFYYSSSGTYRLYFNSNNRFIPTKADGSTDAGKVDVGSSTNYFNVMNAVAFTKRSDRRLKNPQGDISEYEALTILRNMTGRRFNYLKDTEDCVQYGFYAQDFAKILKDNNIGYVDALSIGLVETDEKTCDLYYDEELVTYGLEYEQFIPVLFKGWQYHNKELETLEKENQSLREENESLHADIKAIKEALGIA